MRFDTVDEWLQWQEDLHPTEIDLGLERLQAPLQNLSMDFSNTVVVTVAGTNGKGSCVALLSAILTNAGYRVGSYTSPHLLHYSERIKVNDVCISDTELCQAFAAVDQARNHTTLTYFEFGTLAALRHFSRCQCEVLVLEVGLGGRLDAVNSIDPDIAVITSIGLDHTDWLGGSREAIAVEKAGILRPNGQLVCGEQSVPKSLRDRVELLGVSACFLDDDYRFELTSKSWTLRMGDTELTDLPLPALAGQFQLRNAATAITALHRLQDRVSVSNEHIVEALKRLHLPGRLQMLARKPDQIVDVAHNQQAAAELAIEMKRRLPSGSACHAVFAILAQKDVAAVVAEMADIVAHWHLAPLSPRLHLESAPIQEVDRIIKEYNALSNSHGKVSHYSEISMAWRTAQKMACPATDTVLGFGSFHTVAEILIFV